MKINPNTSRALNFARAREKFPLHLGTKGFLKLAVTNIWESSYEVLLRWPD